MPVFTTGMVLVGGNMGKDSALGHDPLNWMKVGKESKKIVSLGGDNANAAERNAAGNDQTSGSPIKKEMPSPANDDKTPPVPKQSQPSHNKIDIRADIASVPKQKVVIGRQYEKPSAEKAKSVSQNEQRSSPVSRPSLPPPAHVQPMQRSERAINRVPFSLSAERTSTYIVVAYTALLLVLGYFVYNDLSKRTSRIEARLFALEKALRMKHR